MTLLHRLSVTIKALSELGPGALLLYGQYQLGLHSGYLRWRTSSPRDNSRAADLHPLNFILVPERARLASLVGSGTAGVIQEADDIVNRGQVRLFGGAPRPLELEGSSPAAHWTDLARGEAGSSRRDIKLIWEPGRFVWVHSLARAYQLTGDSRYPETFWRLALRFLDANPPYFGPHWESAQEAAIRLISLLFGFQVFRDSPETRPPHLAALSRAIAAHAGRIPPTLQYARAQNNNHLLAEAAGLLTASAALPGHPQAAAWRQLGWRWFNRGLQSQIADDGSYIQQSANYHRLMLQISLWAAAAAAGLGLELEPRSLERLSAATRWGLALLDPHSGRLPNLGPNDGSQLLPLASTAYGDHRPTLAAASLAFSGERPFPPGPWDELGHWLGLEGRPQAPKPTEAPGDRPQVILNNPASHSWAYLRVQQFTGRPGHADLLHFDLWRAGVNLAQDAGTYAYNAPPPWDNALAHTDVHNTVTVGGEDQMTRAGRFLWLDWPSCQVLDRRFSDSGALIAASAQHNGYRRLGVLHRRRVEAGPHGSWIVEDTLYPAEEQANAGVLTGRLHWLLQDWPWETEAAGPEYRLEVQSPGGVVRLEVSAGASGPGSRTTHQLVRAGELLSGSVPAGPTQGWASPTYGEKQPALSFTLLAEGGLPITFRSEWSFEDF